MPQLSEEDARGWVRDAFGVPRETMEMLDRYAALVLEETRQQNLIASSTAATFWDRHIRDSAQLLRLAAPGPWLDIGSGAGMPGLVVAILSARTVALVEQRTRRAEFLQRAAEALGLAQRVSVHRSVADAARRAAVISARAVTSLDRIFAIGLPAAAPETQWLLPKGRTAQDELASARVAWQGEFSLVPSVTDDQAAIVVATDVRRKRAR